jgi:hypothetical protein
MSRLTALQHLAQIIDVTAIAIHTGFGIPQLARLSHRVYPDKRDFEERETIIRERGKRNSCR